MIPLLKNALRMAKLLKKEPLSSPSDLAPQQRPILDHADELIREFEQCRLDAYLDGGGVPTCGWGTTYGVQMGMVWTQEYADARFQEDLDEFEKNVVTVAQEARLLINPHQFAALCSFTYNLGPGCLRTLVNKRDHQQIADAILLYCKDNGKAVRGLKIRRACERELFLLPLDQSHLWNAAAQRARFTKAIT